MARVNIDQDTVNSFRDSDCEQMLRFVLYLLIEENDKDLREAYKESIEAILTAVNYCGLEQIRINSFRISDFIRLMDRLRETYARRYSDFAAISDFFSLCLETLRNVGLIKTNVMKTLMDSDNYYYQYFDEA